MANLRDAIYGNFLIPSPHRGGRCELCRLRYSDPDTYGWLTQQLLGMTDEEPLTQTEIAAEVERRTGESTTQAQVSRHKTRHLDPTLRDAIESMAGHVAMLDFYADMQPAEMAVAYAKLALAKTGELMSEVGSAKSAAPLARATAALASVLQGADEADANAALRKIELRLAELKERSTEEEFEAQFVAWSRQHYPDLEPVLSDPEKLRRLLAAIHTDGANA